MDHLPESGILQLFYGRALAGVGKLKEAQASLEKAAEILPESVDAHLNLGVVYWKLGEQEKARKSWQRVLEIEPRNEQALGYLRRKGQEEK